VETNQTGAGQARYDDRTEAFHAVAESTLTGENLELLNAVLAKCQTADKERNRIAHWAWTIEEQLPDAVVL
jgi:hypothetical protein